MSAKFLRTIFVAALATASFAAPAAGQRHRGLLGYMRGLSFREG